ncbi:MAG: VWA domain-containing protein [Acidobacteriota bacterium]
MSHFAHPWVLVLAVLAPLAAGWLALERRRRQRVPALAVQRDGARRIAPLLALALALAGLLASWMATAGPRRSAPTSPGLAGLDLVLLLDASGSMAAYDEGEPTRLEVAREVAERFLAARPHDRVALVVFAGKVAVLSPLTTDHDTLLDLASRLTAGSLGRGTAIGDALAVALERLRSARTGSRAIVLVSDGLSNAGAIDPVTAATAAGERGVPIDTVAVGTSAGAKAARAEDDTLLRVIAERSGGHFIRAGDAAGLDGAFAELSRLRPSPAPPPPGVAWHDRTGHAGRWAAMLLLAAGLTELASRRAWA